MAGVVSGFLVNPDTYNVPPNNTLLILQVTTWDRQNMNGAVFTISATGYSETATAGADGRVTKLVPSGASYVVSITHQGEYLNDEDQTVIANSEEVAWVNFVLNQPAIEVHTNLSASTWVSDSTYADYPYRCALAIAGVKATDVPEVVFDVEQATSGDYAPVAICYAGGVYIYSAVNTAITVPTVLIKRYT